MGFAIGIDLGGSSVKAVTVSLQGETLERSTMSFEADRKMEWGEKIRDLLYTLQSKQGASALHIGLSAPGLAAADGLSISHMPGRLHGLEGLNWTKFLESSFPVPVLNDAHAALLGESWVGAARNFQNVIMLTLGTGVGGAAIVDGRLLRGAIGRAGHLGHISLNPTGPKDVCLTPGSLELAIGNCTIGERTHGKFQTTHDLIGAHLTGDSLATSVWLRSVRDLAAAIASFINILDCEAVLIGGGISRAGPALFVPLQKYLDETEWRPGGWKVKVIPAALGEYAGAIGAAFNAIRACARSDKAAWKMDTVPFLRRSADQSQP